MFSIAASNKHKYGMKKTQCGMEREHHGVEHSINILILFPSRSSPWFCAIPLLHNSSSISSNLISAQRVRDTWRSVPKHDPCLPFRPMLFLHFIAPTCGVTNTADSVHVCVSCLPFKCTHMVYKGEYYEWVYTMTYYTKSLNAHNYSLEGATKLKLVPLCSPWDALSDGILFSELFLDHQKSNHGL